MKSHASMNRIYRLVWNAALSLWVAVAENAKGRGKGGSSRSSVLFGSAPGGGAEGGRESSGFTLNTACRAALVLLTSLAVVTHEARAADAANASVTAGAGSVSTLGNTTTINQASQRLAIDWTSLSTRANEALVFSQPNASAIALNRIIGSSPSEFFGSLTANGQVFILNPNGVLFGAGSQVNVGGLVASTLNMSNADFMAGNNVFTNSGGNGSVVNQGTMTAANGGYLALLAPEVRNEGVMTASLGTALLAAGNKVTLNLDNGSLLGYSIDQGAVNALAENRQLIQANGGQVLLSAKAMDSLTTATVNNTGVIEAKTLQNKAGRILLMGDTEVGTVNVAGTLDASAPNGGDGGFIETSAAHVKVADSARVTTLASAGNTGKWLIDPNDFTISATGDMTAAAVAAALTGGNFEIQTATMGTAGGNGDIHVNQAIDRTDNNTFTLTAERDININAGANIIKSNAGAAGMTMTAGRNILLNGRIGVGGPSTNLSVTANAAGDITGYGTLNLNGGAIDMTAGGTISIAQIFAGSVKLKATTGELVVDSGTDWRGTSFDLFAGTNIRGTAGDATLVGGSISDITASAGNTGNGRIRLGVYSSGINNLNLTTQGTGGGGQIDFTSNAAVSNATLTAAHNVNASTTGNFNVASLNLTGSSQSVSLAANGGTLSLPTINIADLTLTGSGANVALNGALTAANVTFNASGNIALASDVNTTGAQTYNGNLNIAGPVTLAAGGDIGLGGLTGAGQSVALNSGGTITNTGTTNVGTFTLAGGTWRQVGSVPAFSATDFRISGGTFIRALGGDGLSAGTAYQLTDIYGLQGAGSAGMLGKSYILANDIDASGTANWNSNAGFNPIGNVSSRFTGSFDGLGHTISNLTINRPAQVGVGLFGSTIGAQITRARVVGGSTIGLNYVGGLIGYSEGGAITGGYAAVDVSGSSGVGGLVGVNTNGGFITYSTATGTVTGSIEVGGLVGSNTHGGFIGYSFATGNVSSSSSQVGGLAGSNTIGAQVTDSFATGNVTGNSDVGGLIGYNQGSTVTRSYATTGTVTGYSHVGGLVGYNDGGTITGSYATREVFGNGAGPDVGGLVGKNSGSISNSYATGDVSGDSNVGGLVGENVAGGVISNSYYATGDVSGGGDAGGLVGKNSGSISNSYATGDVSGGGYAGGLVGFNNGGAISNSYATGNVSGSSIDGLVGGDNGGAISNSFHSATANPGLPDVLGTGKTDGELKQASTFVGWDIASTGGSTAVWRIYEGQSMPLLRSFLRGLTLADTVLTYNGTVQTGASTAAVGVLGAASSGRNAGNYNGYYSGQQGYDISGGTLTVTPANLVLTTTTVSKTYNGQLDAAGVLTATGGTQLFDTDTATGGSFAFLDKNAGTGKTVTVGGATLNDGNSGGNYNVSYADNTSSTITQAALTVSGITASDKTYNASDAATVSTTGANYSGLFAGDVVNVAATGLFSDKNVGTNKTVNLTSSYSGADVGNYAITNQASTTATISQANLNVSGITAADKTYNASDSATVNTAGAAYSGLFAGDVVNVAATGLFSDKNVGTGKTVALASSYSGADVGNYAITNQASTTATITQANLTVSGITAADKTYNASDAATVNTAGAAYSGLFAGDVVNVAATGLFSDKNAGSNKTVNLSSSYSGADVGNYAITNQASTTATISQANLTVSGITAANKTYNASDAATVNAAGANYSGLFAGDVVNVAATGLFSDKNVGTNKTVALTSSYSGADVGNYAITNQATTTATISQANLTVSGITASDKTYNASDVATVSTSGANYSGLFAGDVVNVAATGLFSDKNVGIGKTVTLSSSYSGADVGNYAITNQATTTATISQANLTVGGITAADKSYSASDAATVSTTGATYSGLFAGDVVNVTATGLFSDKNVGTGKTVNLSSSYSGADVGNYAITNQATTTASISQANLTVSGITAADKTYNASDAATVSTAGANYSGLFAGDVVNVAATGLFSDKNAGIGKTVTLSSSYSGADVGNYAITNQASTIATISQANLTVSGITAADKTYNASDAATISTQGLTYSGLFAGDVVNVAATGLFSDKNVGTNKTVNLSSSYSAVQTLATTRSPIRRLLRPLSARPI
jgi:filamentous hemagglutinin family protein